MQTSKSTTPAPPQPEVKDEMFEIDEGGGVEAETQENCGYAADKQVRNPLTLFSHFYKMTFRPFAVSSTF